MSSRFLSQQIPSRMKVTGRFDFQGTLMKITHRVCATVSADRSVILENVPFTAGEEVEVTVRSERLQKSGSQPALHGSVKRYEHPLDPVEETAWEACAPAPSGIAEQDLEAAYREMADDEKREADALEWSEAMLGDVADEAR